MNTSTTHSYTARNAAALAQPIGKLTVTPASTVLRWTADETVVFCLVRDTQNLAAAECKFAGACAALGAANRQRYGRRQAQAQAMRYLNSARAQLRQARAALAASFATAPAALAA